MKPDQVQARPRHRGGQRGLVLRMAHVGGGVSMSALARELELSVSWVSRLIAATEKIAAEVAGKT